MIKAVSVYLAIFLISGYSFSQKKYYIPAEDAYYYIEFEVDNRNNVEEYAGLYEDICPGFTETMEYEGDATYEGITLNFDNRALSVKSYSTIEGMEGDAVNEYMLTPEIKGNELTFVYNGEDRIKFDGIFVKGKYKNKNNRKITISGLMRASKEYGTNNYFYTFYLKKDN